MKKGKIGRFLRTLMLGMFLLAAIPLMGYADIPMIINYQGFLTEPDGTPIGGGGSLVTLTIVFSLYSAPSGGSSLWTETKSVSVSNGAFSVILGEEEKIDLPFDDQYYLGVRIEGDGEMIPRRVLTSVAYALNADKLDGRDSTEFLVAEGGTMTGTLALPADGLVAGTDQFVLFGGNVGIGTSSPFYELDVTGTIRASRTEGPNLVIHDSGISNTRPGIQFTNNDLQYIAGDDLADEFFGFYSQFAKIRSYDAQLRVHGKALGDGSWGTYIGMTHDGADGIISTDVGDIVLNPAGNVGIGTATPVAKMEINSSAGLSTLLSINSNTQEFAAGVNGQASHDGDVMNYGGSFQASGARGIGVSGASWGENGRGVSGGAFGTNGWGVSGSAAGTNGRGVYGAATNAQDSENFGGYFVSNGFRGHGVYGAATGESGRGVTGLATDTDDTTNYGGFFEANGTYGRAVYAKTTGAWSHAVYAEAMSTENSVNYGGYFLAKGKRGQGVYGKATDPAYEENYGGYFEAAGQHGRGVYGEATGSSGRGVLGVASNEGTTTNYGGHFFARGGNGSSGVYGQATNTEDIQNYGGKFWAEGTQGVGVLAVASGVNGVGLRSVASGENGTGVYAKGGKNGYAADFQGNVIIRHQSTGDKVMELGHGLDYAEGFDVSDGQGVGPGAVLIIDPDNPGKLTISKDPYDSKVAGIVAGAGGLGSGVRLGAGRFDYDVALAGRVYCNVDATEAGLEPGDLLTTSSIPGYAMKAMDYTRAQGAILGKAMQKLQKGKKGQILVLVALQ